jgi:hypothetical protein
VLGLQSPEQQSLPVVQDCPRGLHGTSGGPQVPSVRQLPEQQSEGAVHPPPSGTHVGVPPSGGIPPSGVDVMGTPQRSMPFASGTQISEQHWSPSAHDSPSGRHWIPPPQTPLVHIPPQHWSGEVHEAPSAPHERVRHRRIPATVTWQNCAPSAGFGQHSLVFGSHSSPAGAHPPGLSQRPMPAAWSTIRQTPVAPGTAALQQSESRRHSSP